MIKILFNEKSILLTENYRQCMIEFSIQNAHIIFDCTKEKVLQCLDLLMISEIDHVIIEGTQSEMLAIFRSSFKTIIAGGGIVVSSKDEYLFIFRRGKWDLPKGKKEEGEDIETCAMREVMEETGLKDVTILEPLQNTYHIYIENEFIFKETYWYLMKSSTYQLQPQIEEGITKVAWIHLKNISFQLNKTYESIKDIFYFLLNRA